MDVRTRTFPSTRDAAADASDFILEAAEELALSEAVTQSLLLVVGEAVANAVGHGNGYDPGREVVVECEADEAEVRLCVEDEGPGIPMERLEHAALPDDFMQTSGRGLFIMKSLADRIWVEDGRRLCMAFDRSASTAG